MPAIINLSRIHSNLEELRGGKLNIQDKIEEWGEITIRIGK